MSQPPAPLMYQSSMTSRPASTNVLGVVGFIFVMIGLAGFCLPPAFLLGVIGTVLCGIGVFRQPRGLAVAGLVVGLLELLVGLVIAVVIGVVIGSTAISAAQNAKSTLSSDHARDIGWSVDRYKTVHDVLPKSLDDLPDIAGETDDGWGHPIRYVPNFKTGTYRLIGNGRDEKPNTPDDMTLADTSVKPYSTMVIPTIPRGIPTTMP